jgi:tripartite-type tricarboxylate transporter receptor subunit TctC
MKKNIIAWIVLAMVAGLWIGAQGVGAQQEAPYPSRPITYLICFDPGGQSDRAARMQQPHLERILGQKVLIDYKVGDGGALGWRELVRGKPDGYLVAGFNIPQTILQPLQQEVGYKTEQINPVCLFQRAPLGLAVLNTSPYRTLQDFIDFGKKNPGALTVGGSGTFSVYHMAALRFEKLSGAKLTYVPFTGSAPQMTAFLGGHLAAIFGTSDDLTRFSDKIRVLGFATEARFPGSPDVPTLKERGVNMEEAVDRGSAVPPETPAYIVKKLGDAFLETAKHPEVAAEMTKQGCIPIAMGPQESKAYLDKMTAVYKELTAGLK